MFFGPDLAHNIPRSPTFHRFFSLGNFTNSIFFDTASANEIIEILLVLAFTLEQLQDMTTFLVKDCVYLICRPLNHFVNLSIISELVPDRVKIACVICLFKSGDKPTFTNYRPVSVLPAFSKILEE